MTAKRRWTAENDTELLDVVNVFLGDGGLIKDAFGYYADCYDRTYEAVRRRYFDIKGEDAPDLRVKSENKNPLPKFEPPCRKVEQPKNDIHLLLRNVSEHLVKLEKDNDELREMKEFLKRQNEELIIRVMELESCESELKQLVSIIDRSRKEAFAPDAGPKKYKVIDGVPVFEN